MMTSIVDALYKFAKPFIFQLDPEFTHDAASYLIKHLGGLLSVHKPDPILSQTFFSKKIESPIGLAAGFDKYGTIFSHLTALGFGFSEIGSFTIFSQKGNFKPRIKRFPNKKALINKMGFNNPSLEKGLANIDNLLNTYTGNHKIALSLGSGKHTKEQDAIYQYESLVTIINKFLENNIAYQKIILYIAINISSPNTPGLTKLQNKNNIAELIGVLKKKSTLPIFVKFSPDFASSQDFIQSLETATFSGADGFILTNTSINYSLLDDQAEVARSFTGGLSGAPITQVSEKYLKDSWSFLKGGDKVLIASGGIMKPEDAWRRILLGASLVQVYTGLIYNGPTFIDKLQQYIKQQLEKYQISSLEEAMNNRDYLLKMASVK